MLIEKKTVFAVNDIVSLRLTTGEEVIAKMVAPYERATSDHVTITKPVVVQMQMISAQQAGVGFAPFMVSADEDAKVEVPVSSLLVAPLKASAEMTKRYIQMTTGIEIPQSGLVV